MTKPKLKIQVGVTKFYFTKSVSFKVVFYYEVFLIIYIYIYIARHNHISFQIFWLVSNAPIII